ncbi:prolyl oligopeptidase family serine peptidase [Myceligenerans xiligouense]|uniref:Prolyl oligopeptidase PreP (S9A serine peptidase family) n=1 Tax=Myceligenerans xiligouense TaxID=253184 RepID=A0A3N4ZL19_9MICO|nr:prolyl oligopeptidase family serine peptidase [Myceligenerans xiligouense]RPF20621.1 prolyl oligopeptidase PreP (S9A serine peptidase family) [Myceligenerans xiligouense]
MTPDPAPPASGRPGPGSVVGPRSRNRPPERPTARTTGRPLDDQPAAGKRPIGPRPIDPRLDAALHRAEAAGRPGLPLGDLRISRRAGDRYPVVLRDEERLVHDPGAAVQRAALSPDGRILALEVSADGTESGALRLLDVLSGSARTVPGLALRYTDMTWTPDGDDLILTVGPRRVVALRVPTGPTTPLRSTATQPTDGTAWTPVERPDAPGPRPRTVWEGGEGERARPVVIGGRLVLTVSDDDGTRLITTDATELVRLPGVCTVHAAGNDALAVSRTALYSLHGDDSGIAIRATAPPAGTVVHALATSGRFWLHVVMDGHSEVAELDAELEVVRRVPVSADDDVRAVTGLARDGDGLQVRVEAPARVPEVVRLDALVAPGPGRAGASRTRLLTVPAADGTPVELVVTDTHDGAAPVLVVAYGGFGVVDLPGFEPSVAAWCELGGRYVTARVRGSGGAPGRHEQGRGPRKGTGPADLVAAARGLVARGLAEPGRIAFSGASHGGLVAASAALAQPGLVAAVTCTAAPLDPFRLEEHPYAAYWRQEFGDPADPGIRAAMADYSPFARLDRYPSVRPLPAFLLTTFDQDTRVSRAPTDRFAEALRTRGAVVGREHRPAMGHGRNALDDVHDFAASVLGFARYHTQGADPS